VSQVAESFEGEAEVVVAKIDADKFKENAGKYGVTGFPTIMWFPKDKKVRVY
jgi:protein disulfide-isomerase A6